MTPTVFTPKQVAAALGVSESSIKRWIDDGRMPASRTAGGHRKVTLPAIANFVRETGHEVARPELVGLVTVRRQASLEAAQDPLFDALAAGEEDACREIVLGFYQRGETVIDLADRLIGPAMTRIGDEWHKGTVRVHQERRACEVMMATLHELRRWLAAPQSGAPIALVATPFYDFSEVAVRLVELALSVCGWRVIPAGSGLPLEEIRDAVLAHAPRLVCLSVTHLETPVEEFAERCNQELIVPTIEATPGPLSYAIGGGALGDAHRDAFECDLLGRSIAELAEFQAKLAR